MPILGMPNRGGGMMPEGVLPNNGGGFLSGLPVSRGTVRRGKDGKTYQFAETTGMDGRGADDAMDADGTRWGWIEANPDVVGGRGAGLFGGLSGFNERHPGLLIGAGRMLQGEDLWPAIVHSATVKKERAAKKHSAEQEAAMEQYLLSEGMDPKKVASFKKMGALSSLMPKPADKQGLVNAGDGMIYDPNTKEWITPPGNGQGAGEFRFDGKSVEGQALNGLMDSGALTVEQAQQMAAGKTITGPNGEMIFMTPEGIFGKANEQAQPEPVVPFGQPAAPAATPPPAAGAPAKGRPGMIPLTEPKVTLDEKKAMTFADRLATSGSIIDELEAVGTSASEAAKSAVPLVGNWLVGSDFQKFDQAQRDFINAQLRRESGAVISDDEFDNARRQYLPQPGDGPEVLAQKRANRQVVIDGMARDGGPTYKRQGPARPQTEAEFDALPSGAEYIDPEDGKLYRKR